MFVPGTFDLYRLSQERLARLAQSGEQRILCCGRKGIEKESLRITRNGNIARTLHPQALGSALTNRFITTDYSEALLEFVTAPFEESWEAIQFLCDVHQFAYEHIGDEMLWVTSMPCSVVGNTSVPIASYGSSNVGTMKHVYRRGLGHRYGRLMQVIAGVHFNYSLPQRFWPVYQDQEGNGGTPRTFVSSAYFDLLRNFRRYGWLVLYLFGASPAVCKSFLRGHTGGLQEFDAGSFYQPHATSLRMSDLGYKAKAQATLNISLNSLEEYVADLTGALNTPYPEYEAIGVVVDGEYRQLNANLLQIENEYYGLMRPKRVARSGEPPTRALRRGGVEYIELRALDISAFDPVGVNRKQLHFLEAFLVFCLLQESPIISVSEQSEISANQRQVARRGREPGLELARNGGTRPLREWCLELFDAMQGVCELLDEDRQGQPYSVALASQRELVLDPDRTPSARILAEMRDARESFYEFGMRMSEIHRSYFRELHAIGPERERLFVEEARDSISRQSEIESAQEMPFPQYLERYYAEGRE